MPVFTFVLLAVSAAPQRPPEPFASFLVSSPRVAVSPHGAFAAIVSDGSAMRLDPRTQMVEALVESGHVAAVALADDSYSLGLRDGRIVHVDANGARREFTVGRSARVLGLQRHGDQLAWWDADGRANVLDLKTGAQRFDPPLEVVVDPQHPAVRFAADGRFLCLRAKSDRPEAAGCVRVLASMDATEVARLPCYASRGDDFVLAGSRIVHAQRLDARTWNLLAFDLGSRVATVLDPDLRGGHFVDLWAAPSGRFVVEGDFEEQGLARYGFTANEGARAEFGPELSAVGCGSLRVDGESVDVLFALSRRDRGELVAVRLSDLTRLDRSLPRSEELGVDEVGTFAGGLGMWHCGWVGAGTSRTRRVQFFSLDPAATRR